MYFVIYKDDVGEWRWRLRAGNHKIVSDSAEGYNAKADCRHGIDLILGMNKSTLIKEV